MTVQAEITFDKVPEYGEERPGAVVASFEVPPPPWEQQQQRQEEGGSNGRWERSSSSSFRPEQPQHRPPQPLPPPPRHVGFFSKRIERAEAAGGPAPAAAAAPKKHLSFNTPQAAAALLPVRAPPLPSDLNEGYPDGWTPTSYRASVSDVVLAARASGEDPLEYDVVSFRSNLRPIFGCCFEGRRKEWTVDAIVLDSGDDRGEGGGAASGSRRTVFLEIVQHLDGGGGGRSPSPEQDRFFFWGLKFEGLCFQDGGEEPPRVGRTEFNAVTVRELPPPPPAATGAEGAAASGRSAPLKLLVVAEMDGFDEQLAAAAAAAAAATTTTTTTTAAATAVTAAVTATLPPTPPASSLVELKTLKWPEPRRDGTLFNVKAPTWWLQCFLG